MVIDTDKIRDIYLSRPFEFAFLMETGSPFPTREEMLNFAKGRRLNEVNSKVFATLFESAFLPEICCFVYSGEGCRDLKLVWERNDLFNSHGFILVIRRPSNIDLDNPHCFINLKRSQVRHGLSTDTYQDLMRKIYLKLNSMRF